MLRFGCFPLPGRALGFGSSAALTAQAGFASPTSSGRSWREKQEAEPQLPWSYSLELSVCHVPLQTSGEKHQ